MVGRRKPSIDGPAVINKGDHSENWYKDDKLHRIGGPAVISTWHVEWWVEGVLQPEGRIIFIDKSMLLKHWRNS